MFNDFKLNVSLNAQKKIFELLNENNVKFFRAQVKGGGCKGLLCDFSLDDEQLSDDFVFYLGDDYPINILVDIISYSYLGGAEIDFVFNDFGEKFIVKMLDVIYCSCGSSFHKDDE